MRTTRYSPFPQTQWTALVNVCREGLEENRRGAMDTLCRDYWLPLYTFARRAGSHRQDAQDLTQGFFEHLLERDLFALASKDLGKLRTFLLTAFQRYSSDVRGRALALKRGGGLEVISLDIEEVERLLESVPVSIPAHEVFDRHWAQTVLHGTLSRLRLQEEGAGRGSQFAALESFLKPSSTADGNYDVIAASLDISGEAARKSVSRLRAKFRDLLRSQIADTLRDPSKEKVDEELLALRLALK